ncbi:hypothetical protein [Burkholderia gladioli]|uniref:hypothetical protein n=1 Tax=Burkholderia gladioli TaxID=28095 RepID=UPI000F80E799|nr:hypothetical protein [Burkholderia gladioli]
MNKLPLPDFDDAAALQTIANNPRAQSYPHLLAAVPHVIAGYEQYRVAEGNVLHVAPVALSGEIEGYLRSHYAHPPAALAHIKALRGDAEQRVCPMCGSMHRGTLDHLLPKQYYAAFSVFSLNLIPACKCNSKRGSNVRGPAAGERVLHPYFDECLATRLVVAQFEDLGWVPRVSLRILMDEAHPDYSAVEFHVREIVLNSAILKYLLDKWVHLCRLPETVVRALGAIPASADALRQLLEHDLELTDKFHNGRNNWNSVFVAGLLEPTVLAWLFGRLAAPGRGAEDPLL